MCRPSLCGINAARTSTTGAARKTAKLNASVGSLVLPSGHCNAEQLAAWLGPLLFGAEHSVLYHSVTGDVRPVRYTWLGERWVAES